jgi:HlyD family secretion protein
MVGATAGHALTHQNPGIFREAAIDRLSSPDQLDHLVGVVRPIDWVGAAAIALAMLAIVAWGFFGRVTTRIPGEGILVGAAGRVADAAAPAAGRLVSVGVAVGEQVRVGQGLAQLAQSDLDERRRAALATLQDRTLEYAQLAAADARQSRAEDASDAARKAGLGQALAAAEDHVSVLSRNVATTEGLVKQGLATQPDLDQMRVELSAARQRAIEARNAVLALGAERLDRQARRARDELAAQHRIDDARRDADQLSGTYARQTTVFSPISGRVVEIKAAPGAYLASGSPVAAVESGQVRLQALVYLPASAGKWVKPGMLARVEPATVRRDEYGSIIGHVVSISPYPATPEAMNGTLQNGDLVKRLAQGGAPYAAVVQLDVDPAAPSGYRWSSGRGPAVRLSSGTLVQAEIATRERRPVSLLLPLIRRVSGSDR